MAFCNSEEFIVAKLGILFCNFVRFYFAINTNNISPDQFGKILFRNIYNLLETNFQTDFYSVITSFKYEVERNLFKGFLVTSEPQEETGRTLLQSFLLKRSYRELETGAGNADLLVAGEEVIIETKIWRDKERYYDGLEELYQYLVSEGYEEGYYVLFDKTQKDNLIVKEKGGEVFTENYKTKTIHVFFIKINPVAPSKKRRFEREAR